jgi:hypothetical protein
MKDAKDKTLRAKTTLKRLLSDPYRDVADEIDAAAKKSWNPMYKRWCKGFSQGLKAAAELVDDVGKLIERSEERRINNYKDTVE